MNGSPSLLRAFARHYWRTLFPAVRWGEFSRYRERCKRSRSAVRALRGRHAGETIICVGNGPSLKQQDLTPLNGQTLLLTNRAYQLLDRFQPRTAYHVVCDTFGFNKFGGALAERPEPTFVVPSILGREELRREWALDRHLYLMPRYYWEKDGYTFEAMVDDTPGFSEDISHHVNQGWTVITIAIQIAAYLGAKRIGIIGVDMTYTGDPAKDYGIKRTDVGLAPPDYEKVKPIFELLHRELAARGVELVNATVGGRVDCLPRMDLETLLASAPRPAVATG